MLRQTIDRILPYTPGQLFDLAADVERYPQFLRWWISARIRTREAGVYYTDQVLGIGPVRLEFKSKTILRRPERIDVTASASSFRKFNLSWLFDPQDDRHCRVALTAEIEFYSYPLERLVDKVVSTGMNDMIAAFVARAQRLYGSADHPVERASRT